MRQDTFRALRELGLIEFSYMRYPVEYWTLTPSGRAAVDNQETT